MVDKLPPMNLPGPAVPYMRALERIVLDAAKTGDRNNLNLTAVRSAAGGARGAADLAKARLDELEQTTTLPPLAPTGVAGTQAWSFDSAGQVSSSLTATWNAVTKSPTGVDVNVTHYEVWLREENGQPYRVTATAERTVTVRGLKINTTFYVRVGAVTAGGVAGSLSTEAIVVPPAALPPLVAPTPPTLASSLGVVSVKWDGAMSTGGIPPQFAYVDAQIASAAGGPWTHVGLSMPRAGSFAVTDLPIDSTRYFKLHAHDKMGGVGADSNVVSIVVQGVDLGSLDGDLAAAQAAVAAAQADVAALSQVVVNENLILDPQFKDVTKWTLPTGYTIPAITDPPVGSTAAQALQIVANGTVRTVSTVAATSVQPGEQWHAETWVRRVGSTVDTTGSVQLAAIVNRPAANGGAMRVSFVDVTPAEVTTTWARLQGTITIPAYGNTLQVSPQIGADVANGTFQFTEVVLRHVKDGALISDGAITASKIAANAVTATHIAAGSIAATQIAAGAITSAKIAAGAITTNTLAAGAVTANNIAAGAISVSHLAAGLGGQLDISANSAVQILVGQVADVSNDVNDTSDNVAEMQTFYKFGPDGAEITTPDSPFSVALRADSIEMLENGNVVSYWNAGQMHVASLVGTEVILGNHKLEKYGTGTVVRAL